MNEDEKITEGTKHTSLHAFVLENTCLPLTRHVISRAAWRKSPLISAQKLLRSTAGMGDKDSSASGPSCGSGCGSGCRWWSANALTRR